MTDAAMGRRLFAERASGVTVRISGANTRLVP